MVLLTFTEIAKRLGITRQAVYLAYKKGHLRSACFVPNPKRAGTIPVFTEAEVARWHSGKKGHSRAIPSHLT